MIIKVPAYVAEKLDGLRKKDFRIQTLKGSGPGGQHRNKRETGVRITHKATGVNATCTTFKSQEQNKRAAFIRLAHRLITHYRVDGLRETQVDMSKTIRTYNFQRHTVKDHQSGATANLEKVLDGDLDVFHTS